MKYNFLRFPEGKRRCVTFSYDDGNKYDIKLIEIMNKYGIKGTFNLCSSHFEENVDNRYLTVDDVNDYIFSNGHELAIHGERHIAPGIANSCLSVREYLNCRMDFEKIFGRIIRGMAYPDSGITKMTNGNTYSQIRNYLTSLGIVYARTLRGDNDLFRLPEDFMAWMPTAHHASPQIMEYIDKFLNVNETYPAHRDAKLFYLWGHSFEFENNNNWELCEEICKKLANNPDVWYATNIEIYDYVKGYNSLVYSADCKTVYNPNLFTVWFEVDLQTFSIKPGETIKLDIKNEL